MNPNNYSLKEAPEHTFTITFNALLFTLWGNKDV